MATPPKRKRLEKSLQDPSIPEFSNKFYCSTCGTAFSRQKGYFMVSHSPIYRGTGHISICSDCIDNLFAYYKEALGSDRAAVKRLCMKLDLYWNDDIYDVVERTAGIKSKIRTYVTKTNVVRYIDKSYDDTLIEEARAGETAIFPEGAVPSLEQDEDADDLSGVAESVIAFWGPGYDTKMYSLLEGRKAYWMSRYPDNYEMSIGEEGLLRQICGLEIEINLARVAGKSTEKSVNALNSLIGSSNLKPVQNKESLSQDIDGLPLGVGIRKWEMTRPVPEPDPELQDVDHIIKYISVWFLGHLCKMLGIKNTYCKLYEEEMEALRVKLPEFDDDDDETVFNNIFSSDCDTGGDLE